MDDKLVDSRTGGPPAKRAKISPSLGSDNSDLFERLLSELPDELAGNDVGGKDPLQTQVNLPDSSMQKNQLSQLLSGTSTPPNLTNNRPATVMSSPNLQQAMANHGQNMVGHNSLGNAVKSPITNLNSPPGNMGVNKGIATVTSINDVLVSSNSMATAFTTSSSISMGNMSMNTKPATSQAFNKGSANLGNPNALMNGPHMTATGLGLSLSRSLATTLSNPQVSYAQTNIIGNGSSLGNTITSTIGANPMNAHTSLGARPTLNTSQPLLQTQNPQLQAVSKGGVPGQVGAPAIQQNATPQLVAPGQAPQQTPSAADPEKRKLIQQQLVLLLHAHKCQRREHVNGARPCALPHCKTMKNVLNHMGTCVAGKNCPVAHCASSRQIITHWKNCTRNDCPVCLPLKNAERKPAAQALDGSQPAQNRNPGQVEVARAYEGLGLNPPVQQQQQPQAVSQSLGQQAGTQGSTSVPQIRPPGQLLQPPPGTAPPQAGSVGLGQQQQQQQQQPQAVSVAGHSGLVNANMPSAVGNAGGQLVQTNLLGQPRAPLVSRQTTLPAAGITTISQTVRNIANSLAADSAAGSATASPDGMTAVTNRPVKEWHQSVTQDLRNHLVHKLVQAIFPTPDPAALRDRRMNNLVQYARKVEGDMYETANSREEYYHLLAEKIYKIQKELEEKRAMRMRGTPTQGQPTDASQPAQPTPPRFGVPNGPGPLGNMVGGTPAIDSPQQVPPRMAAPAYDQFAQNSLGSPVSATGQRSGLVSPLGIRQPITSMGPSTSITQATNTILPASSGPTTVSTASTPLQESQQQLKNALEARHQQLGQKQFPTSQQLPHTMTTTSLSAPPIVSATMSTMLSQQQTLPRASPPQLNESQPSPATSVASSFGGKLATSTASGTIPTDAEVKVEGVGMEVNQEDEDSGSGKPHIMALHMGGHGVKTKMELSLSLRRGTGNIKQEVKSEDIEGVTVKEEGVDVSDKGKASAVSNDVSVKTEAMDTNSSQGDGSSASGGSNSGSASGASASSTAVANKPRTKKVFKPEELRQALMPLLEKLYRQDPESMPFRQPVDPILLGIPDYYDIVKTPMDLSAIKRKLDTGQFTDPWQYIDDVWLMFDNAWLYNRKTSRVYKYCSKLAEVFESEVDGVMQGLGYCCGRKHVFHPQVLCCYGKQLCTIPRDATYFSYQNSSRLNGLFSDRYVYCEKCFNEIKGEDVELTDDPSGPPTKIRKDQFSKEKNDKLDYEPFVECTDCGRKLHQICVLYMDQIWPNGFTCENCLKCKGMKRKENKFISKKLPNTKLGTYLENRVNSFLKRKDSGAGEVTIRVLSSSDKIVEVKPGMRSRFVDTGEMMDSFPYRAKALFAFEEIDGVDVCFFGMHVQEYGSDCSPPNTRRVYIAYLDSVHFFQPRMFRTAVYHEMLIGYLDYAKSLGYTMAHIWACPPSEGDDYIFHCHPAEQKIPKPKRLQEWYKKMLDKAIIERVVIDYKDILKDAMENQMASATEMAYFEGDFWPNVLEESIKELETEEAEKRRREEAEAAAAEAADGETPPEGLPEGNEGQTCSKKGQKSGHKKKNNKSKTSSQRKTSKKSSLPAVGGDELSQKLFSTMEKHKEVFFVIRLHTSQMAQNLPPIHDPDPHINCDLMDGRDAFLTQAREKHYEFSSLRRCKFSTMALLYELHNQGKDNIIYTCNSCSNPVETRYHCVVCDDFDLCVPCWKKESHPHRMEKLGLDLDDGNPDDDKAQDPQVARRLSIQRCIQSLVHACQCRDANCRLQSCQKMKRVVTHTRSCKRKNNGGCPICKQLIALCCYHAKHCQENKCPVPFCLNIKHKLRQQQLQQRLQQAQLLRRRMATMQRGTSSITAAVVAASQTPAPTPSPAAAPAAPPPASTSPATQFPAASVATGAGKPGPGGPPVGAMHAARLAEQAAQLQAGLNNTPPVVSSVSFQQPQVPVMSTKAAVPGGAQVAMVRGGGPVQMAPQPAPPSMTSQPQQPTMPPQPMHNRMLPPLDPAGQRGNWPPQQANNYPGGKPQQQPPQRLPGPQSHMAQPTSAGPSNMNAPQQSVMGQTQQAQQQQQQQQPQPQQQQQPQRPMQPSQVAMCQLLSTLRSPSSPQQQEQVLNILKSNPQLMAAFIKQRQAAQHAQQQQAQQQQQQQQQANAGNQMMGAGGNALGPNGQPQPLPTQQQQQQQQQQYLYLQRQRQLQQQQQQHNMAAGGPAMQQQQPQTQFQPPQGAPYTGKPQSQRAQRMSYPPGPKPPPNFGPGGAGDGSQMMSQFQHQQQQMLQMQQAQLKQQMAGGNQAPMSPQQQHMLAAAAAQQQQANQSPLHQVRSPPTLHNTVRSPQPTPSPRQQGASPHPPGCPTAPGHPSPSPQLMQQHSPHPGSMGSTPDHNALGTDQVMLPQAARTHNNPNQDLSVLNQHPPQQQQPADDVTPLTPQDQLSRFVENL